MRTIDPINMGVVEWSDQMHLELTGVSSPPRLDDPEFWQEWALFVIQSPKIASAQAPDPRSFTDWKEWAYRFNQAIYAVTP